MGVYGESSDLVAVGSVSAGAETDRGRAAIDRLAEKPPSEP